MFQFFICIRARNDRNLRIHINYFFFLNAKTFSREKNKLKSQVFTWFEIHIYMRRALSGYISSESSWYKDSSCSSPHWLHTPGNCAHQSEEEDLPSPSWELDAGDQVQEGIMREDRTVRLQKEWKKGHPPRGGILPTFICSIYLYLPPILSNLKKHTHP